MLNNNSQNPNSFSPDCLVTCSVDGNIIDVARSLCELCRPTQTMIAFLCTNVSTQFKAMLVKQVTLREVARHVSRLGFLPKCNECMQPHGLEQATAVAVALQTMRSFRDIFAVVCSHIQSSNHHQGVSCSFIQVSHQRGGGIARYPRPSFHHP